MLCHGFLVRIKLGIRFPIRPVKAIEFPVVRSIGSKVRVACARAASHAIPADAAEQIEVILELVCSADPS
jgi:hypothetical protein